MQKGNRRFVVKGTVVSDKQQQVGDTPCDSRQEARELAKVRNILCRVS
jgi:hypothetical protein